MNILLDAYFDSNFGDDLFINILLNRYSDVKFYVFWDKEHEQVLNRARKFENLIIMPENCELQNQMIFEAYIMIGGDVLPDGIDYSKRIGWMKHVKKHGGFVAMLGFSLYKKYSEKTRFDLKCMAELADSIVVRDECSARRFRDFAPDAVVTESTDMAFVALKSEKKKTNKSILGIAPRRRLYSTDEEYLVYCQSMALIIDAWKKRNKEGIVRFFSFSTGEFDDNITAEKIVSLMSEHSRVEIQSYEGDINSFINGLKECSGIISTRFHSLVMALIYNIPFVPVEYEVKVTQLLDEIGYLGIRIPYGDGVSNESINDCVDILNEQKINLAGLESYLKKSKYFFSDVDRYIEKKEMVNEALKNETGRFQCNVVNENKELKSDQIFLNKQTKELEKWVKSLQNERNEFEKQNQELYFLCQKKEDQLKEQQETYQQMLQEKSDQLKEQQEMYQQMLQEKSDQLKRQQKLQELFQKLNKEKTELEAEKVKWEQFMSEKINELEALKLQIAELEKKNDKLMKIIEIKNKGIIETQQVVEKVFNRKVMQVAHFMLRVVDQFFCDSKEGRRGFFRWIHGRIHKTNRLDENSWRYNPMWIIKNKLQEVLNSGNEINIPEKCIRIETKNDEFCNIELSEITKNILQKEYRKHDVIFLSVIDYNFRYQRPQHFASRFAQNGHRVFYVNANFIRQDCVKQISDNLYEVDFHSLEHNAIYTMEGKDTIEWMRQKFDELVFYYAIRDAIVVVDYPNWVLGAEYLREKYGFKLVTDYMDDFTGFLGTAEDFLKNNCIRLLKTSDLVVTSSSFLQDVAKKYADAEKISIIRNGTEVKHFYQAANSDYGKKWKHNRKVIGYYGAIAHWFAWEKICYLAEKMPDCDIILIGEVTAYKDKFEPYSNIYLLGEKNYKELPEYLVYFDVCLIPFDTSTDLIKATNPVKFYEYLSAGKKIVATEIPELEPYKGKYVYMANDDEKFEQYVRICLEGTDTLENKEACIKFTAEHDWQKRYEAFAVAVKGSVPLVSVIVLTYNNLELTKRCINSILKNTAYPNYELIIVDNLSTDGTIEYLKALQDEKNSCVNVIFNDINCGFAGGNNIGIRHARGRYVLLLNNDTEVTKGWITNLVKHMENNPKCGMCGSVTNSIGNEAMIRVNYHNEIEMQEFSYIYTSIHMGKKFDEFDRLAMYCTLIKREVLDASDGLDETYEVGMFEDDDYAMETVQQGYELVLAEDVFIHHVNNASFKKLEDETYRSIFDKNRKRYEEKWNTTWIPPKYRDGVIAECNTGRQQTN